MGTGGHATRELAASGVGWLPTAETQLVGMFEGAETHLRSREAPPPSTEPEPEAAGLRGGDPEQDRVPRQNVRVLSPGPVSVGKASSLSAEDAKETVVSYFTDLDGIYYIARAL